jgi:phthiocerol/phenolphthiocerol synthesis type-I polyketide synthase E
MSDSMDNEMTGVEIAIVGMAGRFPDAPDVEAFWRNIRDGVESVRRFDDETLRARGVPADLLADPGYVRAGVVLEDMDRFDAGFFGYSPRDAEQLDPQQRLFLETAWQALEHAGYSGAAPALTGVYAGSGASLYLLRHLLPMVDWRASDVSSLLGLMNGNDKDSLATRVAYKLDLRGPAVSVQTACSTSLVAVHLACRGLLNYEADMALAGGVWLNLLQEGGYRYQPGAILSPDGHCRAFDAEAAGTVLGSGAGIVVLKRLADALADGDTIHAVIKGSALNNDGAAKVGYTAPSVDGQAEAILAAQAMAEVSADSIGYVETHGTGTTLGDPIEIAALTQAFRAGTQRRGYCAIGSVKTNIGHLDAAAGVTGLIKAALALGHKTLPPSLNFREPNPQIGFAESPFYVNTEARPWPASGAPRRAGVSSFGMGGTNVHVILEEAPAPSAAAAAAREDAGLRLLVLSARSATALDAAAERLAAHLRQHPQQALADVAHTLRAGRERFAHRAVALARDPADAARVLASRAPDAFFSGQVLSERPTLAFLFPGQGAQHLDMGRALYEREALFRETLDRCCALLAPHLGLDLRELLFAAADESAAAARLEQTAITQPALFAVEYAMAQLWMSWGVQPDALLGHSIGEYVAACLAGVFSLEDALALVAARGRLLQATARGAMLAVSLPEAELCARMPAGCDLAAVNAADLCVLAGPSAAIEAAERDLADRGVAVRRLHVSRAFHSALVEPMLGEFETLLARVALGAPRIPFVSNLSGRWITAEEACSPDYWVRHVRGTVRFADGLGELLGKPDRILLEVGPGETLSALARRHPQAGARPVLATQCHPQRRALNAEQPARCLAQLWLSGVAIDAAGLFGGERPRRVPLPTYPFERQSYWIAAPSGEAAGRPLPPATSRRDIADWFHVPAWKRSEAAEPTEQSGSVLLLSDAHGLGERLARHLQAAQRPVIRVERGAEFARLGERLYAVRPGEREDFERLLRAVEAESGPLADICHLWSLDPAGLPAPDEVLVRGFHSLLALAQALEATAPADGRRGVVLSVVANQVEDVTGVEPLCAEKATLHGPCKVIPQEYPHIACRLIDVVLPPAGSAAEERLAGQIAAEMATRIEPQEGTPVLAYRGPHRWLKTFEPVRRDGADSPRLRRQGVYLISGGLGGIGLALARHLAGNWQARLVLLGRSALPPRDQWPACIASAERDAALAARLQQLLELEALGAEVLVLQADVADPAQLRQAIDAARRRFGALHGVLHAAGAAGGGVLAGKSRADAEKVFAPKLQGTRHLLEALADETPDFVLLCSSLTAITGGFGQADYCAANCFLDALAAEASRQADRFVLSVNWDTWRETGMAAGQRLPEEVGIAPEQGGRLLEALLGGPQTAQTLVSTLDLERQFAQMRTSELAERLLSEPVARRQQHARPALQTEYVAPDGELEEDLAALWSEFLGISPIGVDDNLFELGGDSLLAIQLLARVRSAYGVELHPAALFRTPTVAALAMLVETRLIEEIEDAETA